jgi:cyclase
MTRALVLSALVAIGALSVAAQQQLSPAALAATKIQQVRNNLYVITGSDPTQRDAFSGGNTGVFVTDSGVVVVDTKLAGWGQEILNRIRTVTDKPVTMIINTHTHGDHTGSNEFFPTTVDIVSQVNTKANMAKMPAFQGDKAKYLPKRTFSDTMTIGSGKDQMDLFYFGRGHTNGDAMILYPSLRVLQVGDLYAWKDAPLCDRANGGSCIDEPKTLASALARLGSDFDVVIPGHSPVTNRAAMAEYQRFTSDLLAGAQAAKAAGKSVDEAAAGIDLTAKYPGYKSDRVKAAVQAIYDELDGR